MKNILKFPFVFVVGFMCLSMLYLNSCKEDQQTTVSDQVNININSQPLNWGAIQVGYHPDVTFTFSSNRKSTAPLTGTIQVSGNGFVIISGGGSYSLNPGATRTVKIRFTPISATSYSGTLSIEHNAYNRESPITILLTGSGIGG